MIISRATLDYEGIIELFQKWNSEININDLHMYRRKTEYNIVLTVGSRADHALLNKQNTLSIGKVKLSRVLSKQIFLVNILKVGLSVNLDKIKATLQNACSRYGIEEIIRKYNYNNKPVNMLTACLTSKQRFIDLINSGF